MKQFVWSMAVLCAACAPGGGDPVPAVPAPPAPRPEPGPISFIESSAAAGIDDPGLSFGAAVGDVDGDGWPDVFTSGHFRRHPRLWRNRQDGTFVDWAETRMQPAPSQDMHAASMTDIDQDGDDEVLVVTGACSGTCSIPGFCYFHDGGTLIDHAGDLGLRSGERRNRTPTPVDVGSDDRIDFFVNGDLRSDGSSPPTLLQQGPDGQFVRNPDFDSSDFTSFASIADLDGDHRAEWLFAAFPLKVLKPIGHVPLDVTVALGLENVRFQSDMTVGDFDNDGQNEIFFARIERVSDAHLEGGIHVEASLRFSGDTLGLDLTTQSLESLVLRLPPGQIPRDAIYLGASGRHPVSQEFALSRALDLGVAAEPADPIWMTAGFDVASGDWRVRVGGSQAARVLLRATLPSGIDAWAPVGFDAEPTPPRAVLLVPEGGAYVDRAVERGLDQPVSGVSSVAADFDNDGDLDLYVLATGESRNRANILWVNDGAGHFEARAGFGAEGTGLGLGDSVVTLDYDRDGRIDLFTVNGEGQAFQFEGQSGSFGDDGISQLFRNTTDPVGHWLQVELRATRTHIDARSAQVEIEVGGKRQIRDHGAQLHRRAQNGVIHFGLGSAETVDRVIVHWPSGQSTEWTDLAADQRVELVEPL